MNLKKLLDKFFISLTKIIPTKIPLVILKGPLKGYKLIMGAPAGKGRGISVIFNRSEPERLKITKDLISPNFVCFDIGANVGIYSLLFSRYSKLIYAFEPFPRNLSFLYRMLKLNNIENVIIVPCAVADKDGLSWFQKAHSNAEGRLNTSGSQPVSVISLDTFIKESKLIPNLLKIDVEGAELSVLKGAKELLSISKPIILIETHGDTIKKKCFEFLKQMGYRYFEPIDSNSIREANDFVIKP